MATPRRTSRRLSLLPPSLASPSMSVTTTSRRVKTTRPTASKEAVKAKIPVRRTRVAAASKVETIAEDEEFTSASNFDFENDVMPSPKGVMTRSRRTSISNAKPAVIRTTRNSKAKLASIQETSEQVEVNKNIFAIFYKYLFF